MKTVLIGNDVRFECRMLKADGEAVDLTGYEVGMSVRSDYVAPVVLEEVTVEGNVVRGLLRGGMQRMLGYYSVTVTGVMNGKESVWTADRVLRLTDGMEGLEDVEENGVTVVQDMTVVVPRDGLSAYEVWLAQGNTGSVEDFIESLSLSSEVAQRLREEFQAKDGEIEGRVTELELKSNRNILGAALLYSESEGYLNKNGFFTDDKNYHNKTSLIYACKEGDIFFYKGKGFSATASAIFRKGESYVDFYQVDSTNDFSQIVIPASVDNVQFSSVDTIKNDVVFELYTTGSVINVQGIPPKSIHGDLLVDNLGLYIVKNFGGLYFTSDGSLIEYFSDSVDNAQGTSQLIRLYPGVDFIIDGIWSDAEVGVIIAFFDKDYNYIGFNRRDVAESLISNGVKCNMDEIISVAPEGSKFFAFNCNKEACVLRCTRSLIQPFDYIQKIKNNSVFNAIDEQIKDVDNKIVSDTIIDTASSESYQKVFEGGEFTDLIFTQIDSAIGSGWKDPSVYKIWATDYIAVNSGDAFNVRGTEAAKNCNLIAFYNRQKEYVSRLISNDGTGIFGSVNLDFIIPEDVYYIRAQNYTSVSAESSASDFVLTKKAKYNIEEKIKTITNTSNVLGGQPWYCCGDSYSEGDFSNSPNPENTKFADGLYKGLNKVYSRFIALRNNMDLHLLAKCGATCGAWKEDVEAGTVDSPTYTNTFYHNQLPQILENENETFKGYITLWFCINDGSHCNLGTIDDETVDTFYGALNWSAIQLITNFPLAKIGFIVSNNANSSYQQAVRDVAQKWAIPYLDLVADVKIPTVSGQRDNNSQKIPVDSRLRALRWDNNFRVASNNGHPNEKAHEYQSTFIENWLRSL